MTRPIFVVGFQRSGTTLLQGLLGAHPDIAAAPETHYFFRIYDLRDYYGDLRIDERLRRVVHDLLHPPMPLLDDYGFDEQRLVCRIRARGATYATVLDELLRDLACRRGAARWSEKTPGQPLASIVELFPDAQIVHLSRDPVDVIGSCVETPWNDRSVADLAGQWLRFEAATRAGAALLSPDGYLPMRYEDLVSDPASQLERVCSFLDIPACLELMTAGSRRLVTVPSFADGWLGRVGEPIDSSSIGRGRSVLSAAEQATVRAIISGGPTGAEDAVAESAAAPASEHAVPASPMSPEERYRRTQQFFADLDRRCRS